MECDTSIQCFDTVSWVSERASGLQKAGRWFVGGDNLTGAFHILQLQLSPPLPSSLAAIKRLTQVHPEKMAVKMERELAVTFLY